jgi:glutamate/tyrosine decarboxylase-like PLP-dependent enzyme
MEESACIEKLQAWICHLQASSPACTELETVVMNWLGKMIGLPEEFLHTRVNSKGGGVIQVGNGCCLFYGLQIYGNDSNKTNLRREQIWGMIAAIRVRL